MSYIKHLITKQNKFFVALNIFWRKYGTEDIFLQSLKFQSAQEYESQYIVEFR